MHVVVQDGKTTYIAEIVDNNAEIEAWDIHGHRIKLVKDKAKRLGITSIRTKVQDATQYNEEYEEKFDKILLDVPCLGIGVLKRKPDIKWQRKLEDVKEITELQYDILNNCTKYLKKNGELVYSTCSIFKEENVKIIEKFISENLELELQKIELENIKIKDNYLDKFLVKERFLQVYQNEKTDGFFMCKIRKK